MFKTEYNWRGTIIDIQKFTGGTTWKIIKKKDRITKKYDPNDAKIHWIAAWEGDNHRIAEEYLQSDDWWFNLGW